VALTERAYGGCAAAWMVIVPLVKGPIWRIVVQSAGS